MTSEELDDEYLEWRARFSDKAVKKGQLRDRQVSSAVFSEDILRQFSGQGYILITGLYIWSLPNLAQGTCSMFGFTGTVDEAEWQDLLARTEDLGLGVVSVCLCTAIACGFEIELIDRENGWLLTVDHHNSYETRGPLELRQ